jgi:tRNA A-37 threonylcarbamoyl transferase component Bud32/tetratricopeptide (TPR) repeat protein
VRCLDRGRLEDIVFGSVSGSELAAAEAHLASCPSCGDLMAEVRRDARTGTMQVPSEKKSPSGSATVRPSPGEARSAAQVTPERIGPYLILEPLGEGGMGTVHTAYHPELDRKVAIKLLRTEKESSESAAEYQARLLREAQAMARLDHPNVVAVHDVGRHENKVYLVMDRVEGATLKDWLAQKRRGWREVLEVFLQAARGLAAAHAAGLIHRDFKPSNVLRGSDGRVRVMDFGLARAVGPMSQASAPRAIDCEPPTTVQDPVPGALASSITNAGWVMGTPRYMAPEQAMGAEVSPRTDQFSFCVALYEALYAERPFDRRFDPLNQPRVREPRSRSVPRFVGRALMRGLAIDPEQRFLSMGDLISALSKNPARRAAIVLLVAMVAALISATAVVSVRESRLSLAGCRDKGHELEGVWDEGARQALRAAFTNASPATGGSQAQAVIESLDTYAASWTSVRGDACGRAASLKGDETALLELTCLGREKLELRALVDVLTHADAAIAANARKTTGLPQPPRRCTEGQVLALLPKPPTDPKVRAEVDELRNSLVAARVEIMGGKPKEATQALEPIVQRSQELRYRPLEAEALAALAQAQSVDGKMAMARATLLKAENAAEAAGNDELAAEGASTIAIRAAEKGEFDEADRWLERAEALLARLGGDRQAEASYEMSQTAVTFRMGKPDEVVLQHAERAYELTRQEFGEDDARAVQTLATLALFESQTQRYEDAFPKLQTVLQEMGRQRGEAPTIVYLGTIIQAAVYSGHLDEAEHYVATGYRLAELQSDPRNVWIGCIIFAESLLRIQQGRPEEAIAAARKAQEIALESSGESSSLYAHALAAEGYALDLEHRYDDAKRVLSHALEDFEKYASHDVDDPVEALRAMAVAEIGLGHPESVPPLIERAFVLEGKHHAFAGQLAALRFTLARAVVASKGDSQRAQDLVDEARAELANVPWQKPLLDEVETWMRSNGFSLGQPLP